MAKKKKKRSRKKSIILFVIEIVVLVILLGGIFAYSYVNSKLKNIGSKINGGKNTGEVSSDANLIGEDAGVNSGVEDNKALTGYTSLALVGIDTRDSDSIDYANSDTMIIASINNDTKKVRLVSVYRDTLLNIDPEGTANQGGDEFSGETGTEAEDNTVGTEEEDDGGYNYDDEDNYVDDNYDAEDTDNGDNYNYDEDYKDEDYYDNEDTDNTYNNYEEDEDKSDRGNEAADVDKSSESGQQLGGTYTKCNAAYAQGSIKQFLTMLNKNLDLNLKDCVVVDFKALATLIDDLGGLDMDLLYEEVYQINDYSIETAKESGLTYKKLKLPEKGTVTRYHLNGVQAVSYARIRKTTGNDPKRTERQRVVINKIVDKAKSKGFTAVTAILNDVLPYCRTTLSSSEIISMASSMMSYSIDKTHGFPFAHLEKDVYPYGKKCDAVIPVTLETNVKELHAFLYDDDDYQVTSTIHTISQDIIRISQLGEDSIELAEQYSVSPSIGGETDSLQ